MTNDEREKSLASIESDKKINLINCTLDEWLMKIPEKVYILRSKYRFYMPFNDCRCARYTIGYNIKSLKEYIAKNVTKRKSYMILCYEGGYYWQNQYFIVFTKNNIEIYYTNNSKAYSRKSMQIFGTNCRNSYSKAEEELNKREEMEIRESYGL